MDSLADRIAMAFRHVQQGRAIIERQHQLIDRRRKGGHSTDFSESLLAQFEQTQAIFEDDLAHLQRQQGPP